MTECSYPHLFEPIRLGNTLLRNRIFACPTDYPYFTHENHATPLSAAYFERKAMGGAALVAVGDCMVDGKRGMFTDYHLHLDDPESMPSLCRVANAITGHGAVASAELIHSGMFSFSSLSHGSKLYGPVDSIHNGLEITEMPEEIIEETIEAFADAAAFAKYCGFGMVTVHAGHGWFLHQFLMPQLNTRKDKWGGCLENRVRLPLAIVERIRKKCGKSFPIEMRISAAECYPGGYDIDEGVAIAKAFDGKVDLINASVGHFVVQDVFTVTHPSMFLEDGVNVKYAAAVKKAVKTPVSAVGALCDPALMEEIIASGKADAVAVARGLIADPDLPMKARAGRQDEIRKCLRCFTCLAGNATRRQVRCAINPEIGFELELKSPCPPNLKKTVLVAGGGISGMEAALTASAQGHKVILCEKSGRLGGVLLCEELVPFKSKLSDYLHLQARLIGRVGIEVRLNTAVTPALASTLAPDVIIAAFGARPIVPAIKGIDGPNVMGAIEAYTAPEKTGNSIIILGGGLVGSELAIFLAQKGKTVTILEMMNELNNGGNPLHGFAIGQQLKKLGIKVVLSVQTLEITKDGVLGQLSEETINLEPCGTIAKAALDSPTYWQTFTPESGDRAPRFYPADTVIYAVGQAPLWEDVEKISCCAPEFHIIGDCRTPGNIEQATRSARIIALDIGRA